MNAVNDESTALSLLQDMTCYKYTVWCIPSNRYNNNPALTWNELYDLGLDPYETINRCGKCECVWGVNFDLCGCNVWG